MDSTDLILQLLRETNSKMDLIYEQTKKTNGRVTVLEDKYHILDKKHSSCRINEISPRLTKVEEQTEVIRFFSKHPFWGKAMLILIIVASFSGGIDLILKIFNI